MAESINRSAVSGGDRGPFTVMARVVSSGELLCVRCDSCGAFWGDGTTGLPLPTWKAAHACQLSLFEAS
jgi:hypothetical protein